MSGFFDDYPRFAETGWASGNARLGARYECLIRDRAHLFRDRSVLDVGSHDGRWAFAALKAGARHVLGIEPRAELVAAAEETFLRYGIDRSRFAFHVGDAREVLWRERPQVEVVFLFGVLYHVHYHVDLIAAARETGASILIVDTQLAPDLGEGLYDRTISLRAEEVARIDTGAVEAFPGAGRGIVAHPSRRALTFLLNAFEFNVQQVPWEPYLARWTAADDRAAAELADYAEGRRATFVAVRRPSA